MTERSAELALREGLRSADSRYKLQRLVGRGGMGEVWKAADSVLGSEVAIKVPRGARRAGQAEHWLAAEAQAVARLSHAHIVSLIDRTTIAGQSALVFQYVSGKPLSAWTSTPQRWPWVRKVADQVLAALAYAHGRGVVHRDLKPGNVLLSGDPKEPWVNLLDFGIASFGGAGAGGIAWDSEGLGSMPGTRAYMAPEQAHGDRGDVGPWTDLYALGVLLTEMLVGQMPFAGETDDELWSYRLRSRFMPPVQIISQLGIPLRRFLLRLLAPDPAQRFGWAADARRALPPATAADLLSHGSFDPEGTDVLSALARDEDRDTDPHATDTEGGSSSTHTFTLEMAPADTAAVQLPPSWAVDQPDPQCWDEGLDRKQSRPPAPVPAASYKLLTLREAPLSGRDDEWEAAWEHLRETASERRPRLLLIEGAQGRGKTRFARELAAVAEEIGVARSHHIRFRGDGSGAGAMRRLLHRVLRLSSLPDELREDRVRRVLAEAGYPPDADLVPRLLSLLSPGHRADGSADEEAATAVELLRVLGRRRPLLLWLEDIDRARDRALPTWLRHLFEAEGDVPVAVVATSRDDRADPTPGPAWVMLRANAATATLKMDRLGDEAIADLLRFTAGASEDLGGEIARWCRGDPRAAQQIARHLHETNRLVWAPDGFGLRGDTPSTAGSLKLDSILKVRARDAVRAAEDSAATEVALDLLSLVRERARHVDFLAAGVRVGMAADRLEGALSPLVLSALVDVRDEGPRLAHTVLAESIREAMELNRRTSFHHAWAEVLEAGDDGPGRAERLLEAAWSRDACGEVAAAARDELEAAHGLRRRRELPAAARAAALAKARIDQQPDLLPDHRVADLLVLDAVLAHETADPPGTASQLVAALDMLQPLWVMLPASAERCRIDLVHAEALRRAGRPQDAADSLSRALEGARAIDSRSIECQVLTVLADMRRLGGALRDASDLAEQAWVISEALDDPDITLAVLLSRLPLAIARGDQKAARLQLDKLRGLLRARASWQDLQSLWVFRGEVERLGGNEGESRRAFETALTLGRTRGLANASVLLRLATMHLEAGDLAAARSALEEAGSLEQAVGPYSHELRASRAVLRAELMLRGGEHDDAAAALQDAEILQTQSPIALPQLQASLRRAEAFARAPALRKRLNTLGRDMLRRLQ